MRFALVPIRELNVTAAIGEATKLPLFEAELERLRAEVASEDYHDFAVEFRGMQMAIDGYLELGGARFAYTRHALTQAVSRIRPDGVVGMAGYLAACPPELRCVNFNYWHTDRFAGEDDTVKGNSVLLRVKTQFEQPLLRAVVSQDYVPIDDVPILNELRGIIREGGHMRSVRGDIRSRFDLFWPSTQQTLQVGQPVMLALRVINSETGASSVRLDPMIYHLATNSYFMIPRAGREVPIRHIGQAKSRLQAEYDRVMAFVEPFLKVLNAAYFDHLLPDEPLSDRPGRLDEMWSAIANCYQIKDEHMESIKARWIQLGEKSTSRGFIAQTIASASQQYPIEEAEELQRIAGIMIRDSVQHILRYKEDK